MNERTRTLTGAAVFAVVGIAVYLKGGTYSAGGANVFPQAIAAVMVLSAAALFALTLARRGATGTDASLESRLDTVGPRMLSIIVLSCLFVVAMPWLGMSTSSFLFIAAGSWSLGLRRPLVVLGAAAAFALVVPWVFAHFLHMLPPDDLILGLFNGPRG